MGQKQTKRYRKTAEKIAKTQAFFLAQNQILEIMNAPLRFRLKFAWNILFPPRNRLKTELSNQEIMAAAHGVTLADMAAKEAEKKIDNTGAVLTDENTVQCLSQNENDSSSTVEKVD